MSLEAGSQDVDDDILDDGVEIPAAEQDDAGPIELTERELMIARGEDPDADPIDAGDDDPEPVAKAPSAPSAPAAPASPAWIDDGVRFVAERVGISEDQISGFSSAKDFYSTARILDDRLRSSFEKMVAAQRPAEPPAKDEPGEPTDPQPLNADGTINVDYYTTHAVERGVEYDDDTLALVRAAKASQDRLAAIEKQWAEAEEQNRIAQENAFHDALDAMDAGFFGKSIDDRGVPLNVTDEQGARRLQMQEACQQIVNYGQQRAAAANQAYQPPTWDQLKLQAYVLAFGAMPGTQSMPPAAKPVRSANPAPPASPQPPVQPPAPQAGFGEIDPLQATPAQRESLLAQSMRRRGAGSGAGNRTVRPAVHGNDADEGERIAALPEVVEAWNRLQQANGTY